MSEDSTNSNLENYEEFQKDFGAYKNVFGHLLSLAFYQKVNNLSKDDESKEVGEWWRVLTTYSKKLIGSVQNCAFHKNRMNDTEITNPDTHETMVHLYERDRFNVFESTLDLMSVCMAMLISQYDETWFDAELTATAYSGEHERYLDLLKFIAKFKNSDEIMEDFTEAMYDKNVELNDKSIFGYLEQEPDGEIGEVIEGFVLEDLDKDEPEFKPFGYFDDMLAYKAYLAHREAGASHDEAIEYTQLSTYDKTLEDIKVIVGKVSEELSNGKK